MINLSHKDYAVSKLLKGWLVLCDYCDHTTSNRFRTTAEEDMQKHVDAKHKQH